MQNRDSHAFALATQNYFFPNPGFFVMAVDGFSTTQFVPPATVVLAEIKTQFSTMLFALSFSDKSFHTMPFKEVSV